VWVAESVSHDAVMQAIRSAPVDDVVRSVVLFDIYRPAQGDVAEKSLAIRLTLNSQDAALTEAQIDAAVSAVVNRLAVSLGARQRA
jgi:phenylalanyl-tRNA synthetase beta chain